MHYSELPPPALLASVVRCFWFLQSDETTGVPQPVVADGRLEIVLHAAEPFARVAAGRPSAQGDALLAGQLTAPLYLLQRSRADVVGIRFRTAAASALVATSLAELTDDVVSLELVDRPLRDGLLAALEGASTPEHRREVLGAVLLRHLKQPPDRLATVAVRAMDRTDDAPLGTIAQRLGISMRTLERRVAGATGLAPRALRQSLRFRRAFSMLQGAAPGTMTSLALGAGYFDQAHCVREFRRFTGQAPTEFFAGDPALAAALVASVQSEPGIRR
jgi:AraC-like DNA-binding protein